MSYKFNNDDRKQANEVSANKDYLPFGVNAVELVGATAGETNDGKQFLELTVTDGAIESNARVWFTGKASPYSLQTIQQIVVHHAKEADKEKARMAVQTVADLDALTALLNKMCQGAELWVTVYYDPTRTYQTQSGESKRSINTNVYGYEPKLKPELMPAAQPETVNVPLQQDNILDDGTVNIPSGGNWG
jgi:hypothetical protein